MISAEEAWDLLLPHASPTDSEPVGRRAAAGRVLSAPLAAQVDVPACDVSAMDGFAVSSQVRTGESLPVTATVAAGDPPGRQLASAEAIAIMTGAPVPQGTDRVIPVELARRTSDAVAFEATGVTGQHIRRRGEVQKEGNPLLGAGSALSPSSLPLLSTHGFETVSVYRKPVVRLIVTGDEVVPPNQVPRPGELRDAHTDFLAAAISRIGIRLDSLGIVGDEKASLERAIADGLDSDVLLLTGGVSMGEFDFVADSLSEHGCDLLFDKVAVQPGKPLVAATHKGGIVFGLPGNPASVMASYWLFVKPYLRRLIGHPDGFWQGALEARLRGPLPGAKGRDRFFACTVHAEDGALFATPSLPKGSHDVAAYAAGEGLVRVLAGASAAKPGDVCQVLPTG